MSLGRQRVKRFGGVLRRKVDIGDEMDDRLARRFLRRPARRHRDLVTVEQRLLAAGTGGGGGVHGADIAQPALPQMTRPRPRPRVSLQAT